MQATLQPKRAIGIILPSSNRIVERVTQSILSAVPDMDACFARVPYGGPPDDYDIGPFDAAAGMLKDARVDVICWNATRGALLGFEPDRRLCGRLAARTGLPVVTTALSTLGLLKSRNLSRIAMLVQGSEKDEDERLTANFAREGIHVVAARYLGITDNFEAAQVSRDRIGHLAEELARQAEPDAILIWSTNLPGFELAAELEARAGVVVLDSSALGILSALQATSVHVDGMKQHVANSA